MLFELSKQVTSQLQDCLSTVDNGLCVVNISASLHVITDTSKFKKLLKTILFQRAFPAA